MEYVEGARGCAAQRSRRGKGPFMPRKALAIGRAALPFAPEAVDERRGRTVAATKGPGRARTRAAHRTRPTGRAGRRRIFDGNHRCMAHNADIEFRPSGQSIMGQLCLPCACAPQTSAVHRLGINAIDKVTICHQAIGCSYCTGGNFDLTPDRSIWAGNTGIESAMDNVGLPRYRVN